MLFLVEIGLALFARKRGWKGWGALPVILGMISGVGLGIFGASSGMELETLYGLACLLDGAAILALIIMCAVGGPYKNEVAAAKQNQAINRKPHPNSKKLSPYA